MASKKQKPQGKTSSTSQSDPWEVWWEFVCVDEVDRQAYLENQTGFVNEIKAFDTRSLRNARDVVSEEADEIDSETFDAKEKPVKNLAELEFKTGEYNKDQFGTYIDEDNPYEIRSVRYFLDKRLFRVLKRISVVDALPEAMEKLKDLAHTLIGLLMAGRKFFTKKIELANAIELESAAEKLEDARKKFCMIELTGDIDKDAKRLFLERHITPNEFRAAMLRALKLDWDATEEINNEGDAINLPHHTATSTLMAQGHGSIIVTQKSDEGSTGVRKKRTKKRGRKLSPKELNDNAKKNELIVEIRRRAKTKYFSLGKVGITAAYDEINEESKQVGSKWHSIMSLASRTAIIDKALHDTRYVTSQ